MYGLGFKVSSLGFGQTVLLGLRGLAVECGL